MDIFHSGISVKPGEEQTIDVVLKPTAQQLDEVTVKAKKYKKKDNPVVELIELVIAHRDQKPHRRPQNLPGRAVRNFSWV